MIKKRRTLSAIGIDIDRRSISAMQLCRRNGGWDVHAAATLPRMSDEWPPSSAEIQRLGDVLERQGFTGPRVALAIPNDMLLTAVLDAPPMSSGAPIEQIARMELARIHKKDADKLELYCWELPSRHRNPSGSEARSVANVMAAGCVIDDVVPLLDAFEQQHWDVQQLNVTSWAMPDACRALVDGAAATAFLDINWSECTVALLHKGVVVYQRALMDGGLMRLRQRLVQDVGCAAEVADVLIGQLGGTTTQVQLARESNSRCIAEANRVIAEHLGFIMQEVRASCSYLGHRFADAAPRSLVVVGGGANIPGALEILGRGLDMEVRAATPAECLGMDADARLSTPTFASHLNNPSLVIALGLAIGSLEIPHPPEHSALPAEYPARSRINLVPRSRRLAKHRRKRKRLWVTIITAYSVLVVSAITGSRLLHVFDSRAVATQIETLESQIQKASEDAKSLRAQIRQVKDTWETANVVNSQPDWSLLLALIADVGQDHIMLSSCELAAAAADESSRAEMPATPATASPSAPTTPTAAAPTHSSAAWTLNLSGRARSQSAVSQFVLRLEQLTLFEQVRLVETRREPSNDARADTHFVFLITCTMR